ncbi:MAG: hypothetical protein GWO40_05210, partial [Gammaproteobacteria bacterium]|nr:hypothetical protein [Gammaproteobacteria bacterium]NIU03687.1 hypothetical protein [Gammaproteobacteria bacterium]NIX84961.1 hypothetical protein [Gammaproteobacteria bacterium]
MVHGAARGVGFWSNLVSAVQTGAMQSYLLYFIIGAVVIIGLLTL